MRRRVTPEPKDGAAPAEYVARTSNAWRR
jgi:hypothetical protein